MRAPHHRLTNIQRREVRRQIRALHRDWVSSHTTQGQAALHLTNLLGFTVTRTHIGTLSRAMRLRWPFNPHPHRSIRPENFLRKPDPIWSETTRTPTPKTRPGKKLSHEAIDDLRFMADHLLAYAAEIEYIINNGHPSTT